MERAKAGKNEKRFVDLAQQKITDIRLTGKQRFTIKDVEISADQSLTDNGIHYLVEVDSGNMAKLLVGQYVLLNQLYNQEKGKAFFLVVHTYKNYNPQRTIKNLSLINEQLYAGTGIKFGAMHIDTLQQWQGGGISDFLSLISMPNIAVERDSP
ncbi:hypothetical protein [Aquitalea sp. ASV15]|uniref:hypothetical protein n=1 Tax=Aquitalea sp. ASV15 TaxID=2795104 RepID=UPI0018EC1BF1|nr:hypothetical protein [Aquitalea sp. ASV15]